MKKLLVVVDMQNDFISGSLGSPQARAILPAVKAKIESGKRGGDSVVFTRDTHGADYLDTQEGKLLPVPHCIAGTQGHEITSELDTGGCAVVDKPAFGSAELAALAAEGDYGEIELCGLCTDICVVSNALILKARLPETPIRVDARCCAGVTEESHRAALLTMKMCQVLITE
ncbi:MAG: cysteine hydrolase [Oscillospiraceae bacterium]|nr:cysteine hydrolase [Oscillospiraceae bacterium]